MQFYHACDGDRELKYLYCMTRYGVLANGDFFASTCSLWVTVVAMAQLSEKVTTTLQMAGPLALIIGVLLDRHSLWVIAVPCITGLLIIGTSWVSKCCTLFEHTCLFDNIVTVVTIQYNKSKHLTEINQPK